MNMIKVLHVGLSSNPGGIESVVLSWAKVKPSDIKFILLNVNQNRLAYEDEFIRLGCEIVCLQPRRNNPFTYKKKLKQVILDQNINYVHCHMMSFSDFDPIVAANEINGVQAIMHIHLMLTSSMSIKTKILNTLGKIVLQSKKYIKISCGQSAGKLAFGNEKFDVINNGIDIGKYYFNLESRNMIRKNYAISSDTYVIGHVGRPGTQKNYPYIFNVFSKIVRNRKNVKLMLIGNICNDEQILKLIEIYGLQNYVIMTGIVKTCDYYSAMDLFFFPSLYEGLSVSLIEAQISGLPCVISDVQDPESVISKGTYLTTISSADVTAYDIMKLMDNGMIRFEADTSNFDIAQTSKKIFTIYRGK